MTQATVQPNTLPFSKSVRAGDTIYVSGLVPIDNEGNIVGDNVQEQTRDVLDRITSELERHGASKNNLVKMVILLTNIDDWPKMNEVYKEYVNGIDPLPARAAYEVRLAAPGLLVEIEAVAYVGEVS